MPNIVYIATSLDGYIADRQGGLDWLHATPNPDNDDLGWGAFLDRIDALVMGRTTYETVRSIGGDWPYPKPVFVLSTTLTEVPQELAGRVELMNDDPAKVVARLHERGFETLYIDGGKVIQGFLAQDLIDELILTRIPVLLGGGTPLFDSLPEHMEFTHRETSVLLNELVMSRYERKR